MEHYTYIRGLKTQQFIFSSSDSHFIPYHFTFIFYSFDAAKRISSLAIRHVFIVSRKNCSFRVAAHPAQLRVDAATRCDATRCIGTIARGITYVRMSTTISRIETGAWMLTSEREGIVRRSYGCIT